VTRGLALLLLLAAAPLFARASPAPAADPYLRILAPLSGQTRERVVTIRGVATDLRSERLTLVLNGVPLSIPRKGQEFETRQVLAPGRNSIRVLAEEAGKVIQDSVTLHARVPAKDLRVTLTWDTPRTDVDLWVTGPDGERVMYNHREGKLGGSLDTDVTEGHGPETFTLARLSPGAWRIQAHYYGGAVPTWVEVTVVEHEGEPAETRRVFRGLLLATGDVLEVGEVTGGR
jgi:uncharacterized protein YfaP (DUF2135 family)